MMFAKRFVHFLTEDISDLKTLFKKGGNNVRHRNASTSTNRPHQNMIAAIHRADGTENTKIEQLKKRQHGVMNCDNNDLVHIINTYIKQGDQTPCDINNVQQLASQYLSSDKTLGSTGIVVRYNPGYNVYQLVKQ